MYVTLLIDLFFSLFNLMLVSVPVLEFWFDFSTSMLQIGSGRHTTMMREFFTENRGKYSFPKLESIRLVYQRCSYILPSMDFIHFIAVHSPNLKSLNVETEGEIVFDDRRVSKMQAQFIMFRESCPQVSLSYLHFKQPNRFRRWRNKHVFMCHFLMQVILLDFLFPQNIQTIFDCFE